MEKLLKGRLYFWGNGYQKKPDSNMILFCTPLDRLEIEEAPAPLSGGDLVFCFSARLSLLHIVTLTANKDWEFKYNGKSYCVNVNGKKGADYALEVEAGGKCVRWSLKQAQVSMYSKEGDFILKLKTQVEKPTIKSKFTDCENELGERGVSDEKK